MYNRQVAVDMFDMCDRISGIVTTNQDLRERARDLMFMTAAHESGGFLFRRQKGFGRESHLGAFGLFQTEWAPCLDNLRYLSDNGALLAKFVDAIDKADGQLLTQMCIREAELRSTYQSRTDRHDPDKILFFKQLQSSEGDDLAAIMCRVHYLRVTAPIPSDIVGMAAYAKRYYNTAAGAATPKKYEDAYKTWIRVVQEEKAKSKPQ